MKPIQCKQCLANKMPITFKCAECDITICIHEQVRQKDSCAFVCKDSKGCAERVKKAKDLLLTKSPCVVCKSKLVEAKGRSHSNGICGPGSRVWTEPSTWHCDSCGLVYFKLPTVKP